jgi:hypothetical protein
MTRRSTPKAGVYIGKLRARGRYVRDLLHVDPDMRLVIDEMDVDADVGGDLFNAKTKPKRPRASKPKARAVTAAAKAITHAALGALSIASMVTAAGITAAFGWN